jgi:hypothetical protein
MRKVYLRVRVEKEGIVFVVGGWLAGFFGRLGDGRVRFLFVSA